MQNKLTVYTYAKCSTCRDATAWLRQRGIAFEEKPIRETPPTPKELEAMLRFKNGELRRLFNTSGQDYRAAGLAEKLDSLSRDEAFALLAKNGMLVKRPFLLGKNVGLVGFKPDEWEKELK